MGGGIGGGGIGCCMDIIGGGMFPGGIPTNRTENINDGFDKYMYHNYFMDIIGGVIPGGICTKQTEKCNIND